MSSMPPSRPASGTASGSSRYRPLFSGPAVERTPELQFQRPPPEAELSPTSAPRGAATGNGVTVPLERHLHHAQGADAPTA